MSIIASQLNKTLSNAYNGDNELKIYLNLVSEFYLQNTDPLEVEKIIIECYNQNRNHTCELAEILKFKDDLYEGCVEVKSGVNGIETLLKDNPDKKSIMDDLKKILAPYTSKGNYKLKLSDTKYVYLDINRSEVNIMSIRYDSHGHDTTEYTRVLACYPIKIIIHDNPISIEGRRFSITWITFNNDVCVTENMLIPEIETYLENHGYVLSPRLFKGIISGIIQISLENETALIKNEIETPGFYYNAETEQLDIVDYEYTKPSVDDLKKSLKLMEDLKNDFKGHDDKLATTLKHGLIAPFGFAKKQLGLPLEQLIPYLYHFGKGGSGKTTIARIALYFWGEPDSKNDIGGTDADTIARLGEQVSKSTFLKIINEPESIFEKKTLLGAIKTGVERTNIRSKFKGNTFENILSLATMQFTSNDSLPEAEGLARRFFQLLYTHSEKKTDKEKEAFSVKYRMDAPALCRFHDLKPLANFSLGYIQSNIDILRYNWKDLSNLLITKAYGVCGWDVPEWLMSFAESVTLDDIDDEEIEELRVFFISEINKHVNKIRVYDDNGFMVDDTLDSSVKTANDFYDRVFNVVNEHCIPYMIMHHAQNGKDYVCFTSALKKALHQANHACYNLKGVAELLGWNYKSVKLPKVTKVMIVRFDKFLKFLYPDYGELEDN